MRSLKALLAIAAAALPLCRYTVRDVAFVDLGDDAPYRLVVPAEESGADLRRMAAAVLLDSNVELAPTEGAVGATLVDPDGRELGVVLGEHLGASLARVVESPRRRDLVDVLLSSYGAVVLALGTDEASNAAARDAVDGARADLDAIFDAMPKAVGDPPVVVEISAQERADEAALLWSLGIEPAAAAQPAAAVLMGRARRVGPPLRGAEITRAALFGVLAIVGQSCECDLDRSWMQGRRVPLRWGADTRARAVAALGFDPESPLVRAEIAGILARGPSAGFVGTEGPEVGERSVEELLLGYSEIDVAAELARADAAQAPAASVGGPGTAASSPQAPSAPTWASNLGWMGLAGVLLLSLVGVVFVCVVILRERGR